MLTTKESKYVKMMKVIQEKNSRRGADNRARGEAFEFRVMRKFKCRSDVMWVVRSAGSHSIIDIIVQMKNKKQVWITCKTNSYTEPGERRKIREAVECKPDNVEVREYYYSSPKVMRYRTIG
jgi:hypothetical protein